MAPAIVAAHPSATRIRSADLARPGAYDRTSSIRFESRWRPAMAIAAAVRPPCARTSPASSIRTSA
jgi:hypothetical protein